MRLSLALLTATLLTGSLAGCSSGYGVPQTTSLSTDGSAQMRFTTGRSPTANVVPVELRSSVILAKIHAAARHDAVTRGIYASANTASGSYIYGYSGLDSSNGPPVCSIGDSGGRIPVEIAVDRKGDLMVVGLIRLVVYAGPGLCGPELGSIGSTDMFLFGQDVASRDAQSGTIVIGVPGNYRAQGDRVAVCTLSGGCTKLLRFPKYYRGVTGVALAPNGDCWASGYGGFNGHVPFLGYFAHCQGRAVLATGYQNTGGGSLDIDDKGNLVSLAGPGYTVGQPYVYIYSGCNPKCRLVGAPSPLHENSYCCFSTAMGHLDASSKHLIVAGLGGLSVYSYSTSGVKYLYTISPKDHGFSDAAFSPSSRE